MEFQNRRAQYYWKLMRAFDEGRVDIDDDELANELCYIEAKYGRKIKILEKDQIKVRLKRSPDLADAMMLAWSEDEADVEREVVRFL
jgi:translation initiation factor IF-1